MKETYRFSNDSVYEYSYHAKAYILIGKLNGRTKRKFINDYEGRV